ncbi:Crp/Fnr family transcriptional regulator [uncultured Tenacibaculum sp.]|uniref:Crp/Fnr family transcriptional regulator n=1 Tax=uncultured Tenacibaculum sp. TaxID=174713 RepID=UPI00262C0410|nr:Crp/Fnr family transcriptional regulator [uncultured Tenacibaculum sp.]
MRTDIEQFLYQFTGIPSNIISIFENLVTYSELEPLDFLVKTNEYPTDFFIIKTGIVRSYLETETGKEATRTFFTSGQTTGGASAMMREIPSELNYQALTKVTGYRGSFHKFKELTLKHHEMSTFYVKILEDAYLKAENIILDISMYTAKERYLKLRKRIPGIDNLIAQKHIASFLNISPVQLSRIKKAL